MRLDLTFENATKEVRDLAKDGKVKPLKKYLDRSIKLPHHIKTGFIVCTDFEGIIRMTYIIAIPTDLDIGDKAAIECAIQGAIQLLKNSGITVKRED